MKNSLAKFISLTTVIALLATPTTAFAASYNDYDDIVNTGIVMPVTQKLVVTNPSKNIKTTDAAYFISGTSNPKEKLYVNGEEVTSVGIYGSFGVYTGLALGDNVFTFKNGDSSKTVTITRVSSSSQMPAYTTNTVTNMYPTYDDGVKIGSTVTLQCTAPAGATVYATIGGVSVQLAQVVPNATTGVAAVFKGGFVIPNNYPANQTTNIGKVKYTMTYNGTSKAFNATGDVYAIGASARMVVKAVESATMLYNGNNTNSGFFSTLRLGSTDRVIDQTADMFRLGLGGWVKKNLVTPIEGNPTYLNKVSQIDFKSDSKGESYIFTGTANASFKAGMDDTKLVVELYNTSGIGDIFADNSKIFSNISTTTSEGKTSIVFTKKNPSALWGYNVEYKDGKTIIYCKYPPKKSSDPSKPLKGITIALDPGHGGNDPGALGVANMIGGPVEKELTLSAAIATKKRLESLGAEVVISRTTDVYKTFNERMTPATDAKADFYISLHYNSIGGTDQNRPNGTEVYYYEGHSAKLAATLAANVSSYNKRLNRGAKYSSFRVTLNTYAPSVLVELGFISNPIEYDNARHPSTLFNTANAIADSIVALL